MFHKTAKILSSRTANLNNRTIYANCARTISTHSGAMGSPNAFVPVGSHGAGAGHPLRPLPPLSHRGSAAWTARVTGTGVASMADATPQLLASPRSGRLPFTELGSRAR